MITMEFEDCIKFWITTDSELKKKMINSEIFDLIKKLNLNMGEIVCQL
jgi:hypothetical protein